MEIFLTVLYAFLLASGCDDEQKQGNRSQSQLYILEAGAVTQRGAFTGRVILGIITVFPGVVQW